MGLDFHVRCVQAVVVVVDGDDDDAAAVWEQASLLF